MLSIVMQAPSGFGGIVEGTPSGTNYVVPANGIVTGVQVQDMVTMIHLGFAVIGPAANIGTSATGVTAVEVGDGYDHTTILTVNTVLPAIAGGAALGVGVLLYTLPAGAQMVEAVHMALAITQTQGHINADTPTVGIGTVIATGAVSVLSGTATFQNLGVGKAAADANGTATVQTSLATASPFALISEIGGVKSVYFNAAFAWAASGDAAAKVTGTLIIKWNQLS